MLEGVREVRIGRTSAFRFRWITDFPPYAWDEEQIDELWADITNVAGRAHFMGSLVLTGEGRPASIAAVPPEKQLMHKSTSAMPFCGANIHDTGASTGQIRSQSRASTRAHTRTLLTNSTGSQKR